MRGPPSIALRLTFFVSLAVMIGGISTWPFLILVNGLLGVEEQSSLNALGLNHAQYLVQDCLRRDARGAPQIVARPALLAYRSQNPNFRFAVFEDAAGVPLTGSDMALVAAMRADRERNIFTTALRVAGDPTPNPEYWLFNVKTPIGRLPIAVYGYTFHWGDLLYIARDDLFDPSIVAFLPGIVLAVGASWFVVRRGLAPLGAAARRMSQIDFDALDRRLDLTGMPAEVAPFAKAVNETLSRLETGVAAQRRFIANAAHELRTPIAILCAHIDNPVETTLRKDVKRDAFRLRTIVEQLLASASIAKRREAVDAEVDLGQAILEMILDYMPLAVENGRKIELDRPAAPVMARGDRRAIESIVANLIDNALRAEPEGGTVQLRVGPDGVVDVVDHGAGVAPQDREKIFEPFWRKPGAKNGGTGLGLSIVREMMEKLGGKVWVEETPGGGATFKVALPIIARAPESQKGAV